MRLKWREVGIRNIREKNAASLAPQWDGRRSPMQFQLFLVVFSKWLVVLLFHPQAQLWCPPCYTRSTTLLSLMVNKHLHELMNTMDRKLSKLKWCIRFLLCPQVPRHHGADFSWLFCLFSIHSLTEGPLCIGHYYPSGQGQEDTQDVVPILQDVQSASEALTVVYIQQKESLISLHFTWNWDYLVAQMVKNLPAMQET